MAADPDGQLPGLVDEIDAFAVFSGNNHVEEMLDSTRDMVDWIAYFRASDTGCATDLIDGAQASVLEAVGYVGIGLGRASLGAIRREMELVLAYTYFKDHPVEWDLVRKTGDGFKLPGAVRRYHRDLNRQLAARLALVEKILPLTESKLYRILSAHLHGQSHYTIPRPGELKSLVISSDDIGTVVEMQRNVCTALNFYLVAVFAEEWTELPGRIVSKVSRQILPEKRPVFFGLRG